MDDLNDILVKLHLRKENHKRKKKYTTRNKYLTKVIAFASIWLVVILIAVITSKKNGIDPNSLDGNNLVIGNSTTNLVDAKYDPNRQLLISQYFVGDHSDVDAVADDSTLANLTYKTFSAVPDTNKATPKTQTMRINDHYLVVVTKGLPQGFDIIRYQFKPIAINRALGVGDAQVAVNYLKENNIKHYRKLKVENKQFYTQDYERFLLKTYQNIVKRANNSIQVSKAKINENQKLIGKLKQKELSADDADATDLQSQISDIEDKIDDQKTNIQTQTKKVNQYQKEIDSVKTQLVF